jgi:hypothetical protein
MARDVPALPLRTELGVWSANQTGRLQEEARYNAGRGALVRSEGEAEGNRDHLGDPRSMNGVYRVQDRGQGHPWRYLHERPCRPPRLIQLTWKGRCMPPKPARREGTKLHDHRPSSIARTCRLLVTVAGPPSPTYLRYLRQVKYLTSQTEVPHPLPGCWAQSWKERGTLHKCTYRTRSRCA